MKKNNLKIFQEYSSRMHRKTVIVEIFELSELEYLDIIDVNSESSNNKKRRTIIVDTLNTITGGLQKVIIDIKLGLPTWQYMMDTVFYSGFDREIKIIIYDSSGVDDLGRNKEIAAGFAKINNQHGKKIYLLEMKQIMKDEDVEILTGIIQIPSESLCNPQEHSSLEEFKRAEYWVVYHYYFSYLHYDIATKPEIWLKYQIYEEFHNFGFFVYWTENGFFLDIMGQHTGIDNIIESVLKANLIKIQDGFISKKLISKDLTEKPTVLRFKILDIPYQSFYTLSQSEKQNIAHQIFTNVCDIKYSFDEAAELQ